MAKQPGEISFAKSMAVLGLIIICGFVYALWHVAPNLSPEGYHKGSTPVTECLRCHLREPKGNPIIPHRPADSCTLCHFPAKNNR